MHIRSAAYDDTNWILAHDRWIRRDTLQQKIGMGQVYVAAEESTRTAWLRYGLFWDNTPFLYMLHVLEKYRGKGIGTALVTYWEQEMKRLGYTAAMTSTAQTDVYKRQSRSSSVELSRHPSFPGERRRSSWFSDVSSRDALTRASSPMSKAVEVKAFAPSPI